jgi:all-trans-8'-apo-beta-carotenal 15,15'-oxygenase
MITLFTTTATAVLTILLACFSSQSLAFSKSPSKHFLPNSPIITTGVDFAAWKNAFSNCPRELEPTIIELPEAIPPDFPTGTYYRNGHARFCADDATPCLHPFDADGMIVAITFDSSNPSQVLFRNKFIETEGYIKDKEMAGMSQRGLFGTKKTGGRIANLFQMDYKHVANTNVIHSGESLYALWEGGKPYLLDPLTLCNKNGKGKAGLTDLDGLLSDNFSAHPRYDPVQKTYVNFGSVFDPIKSEFKVSLYEVDATTFRSKRKTGSVPNFVLDSPALLHDFMLTLNYCIFIINDTRVNIMSAIKAMFGFGGFAGSIEVDKDAEYSFVVLIPRSLFDDEQDDVDCMDLFQDERIIVVPIDRHFAFHHANAFEDMEGNLVFDTVQMDDMELGADFEDPFWQIDNPFKEVFPTRLMRYTIDIQNKTLALGSEQPNPKVLTTRLPEFPSIPRDISTKRHRYIYPAVARKQVNVEPKIGGLGGPVAAVAKIDAEDSANNQYFSFEPHEFPGEAILVPKTGRNVALPSEEDACYLLVQLVNGKELTTDVAIFDVEGNASLEKGPILRFPLPVFTPHMLHGSFAEGVEFRFGES